MRDRTLIFHLQKMMSENSEKLGINIFQIENAKYNIIEINGEMIETKQKNLESILINDNTKMVSFEVIVPQEGVLKYIENDQLFIYEGPFFLVWLMVRVLLLILIIRFIGRAFFILVDKWMVLDIVIGKKLKKKGDELRSYKGNNIGG